MNARQTAIYLVREMLDISFPNIGEIFKKNHTTIMYSHDQLKKKLTSDKALQITVKEVEKSIR